MDEKQVINISQFNPKRTIRDHSRLLYVLNREETNQILYRKEFDENRLKFK